MLRITVFILALIAQILGPILFDPGSPYQYCTYYIDPSGNDSNNGLTPATAWQTVSKVNAATLTPGQSACFKSGGTWRETLTPGNSGNASASITFTSYGSGAQPILSGSNLITMGWTESTAPKQVFLTSTNASYSVPGDWNNAANTIETIGGGGAGHDGNGSSVAGAGGGGGGYSRASNITLPATVSYVIGAGGVTDGANGGNTWFCNATTNCASDTGTAVVSSSSGGLGATNNSTGANGGNGVRPSSGGTLTVGGNGGSSLSEGGGGGGAAGPNGVGKVGGASAAGTGAGGGGGGNGGGTVGSPSSGLGNGGNGGNNSAGAGHGIGGTGSGCTAGTVGGGGGGGDNTSAGCNGGAGIDWDSSHGSGGGAGGGGIVSGNGGNGGLYGGGGAGSGGSSSAFGSGASGIVVLTYTAPTPSVWQVSMATQPNIVYFNGTRGTLVASVAAITTQYNWYWAANVLYVYSPSGGDPSVYYTMPGIEAGQRGRVITTNAQSYLTFNNLDIQDSNSSGDVGIAVSGGTIIGIAFTYDTLERGNQIAFGLAFSGTPTGIIIDHCTIKNNGGSGIWVYNQFTAATFSNNTITGNGWASIRDNQEYSGIEDALGNANIFNNTIYSNAPVCKNAGTVGYFCHGIYVGESTSIANIHDNITYSMTNGTGIKAIGSALIQRNTSYLNGLHGIQLGQNISDNVVYSIYYNVAYSNNQANLTGVGGIGELNAGAGTISLTAEQNTFYNNGNTNGYEIFVSDNLAILTLRNNILYASATRPTYGFAITQTGTDVIDYDLAWRADGNPDIIYNGIGVTWAFWMGLGFDTHGINLDPLFTNAGAADFTLQGGSPAINAGICIGGLTPCPTNIGAK